jgi:hypothetical protein
LVYRLPSDASLLHAALDDPFEDRGSCRKLAITAAEALSVGPAGVGALQEVLARVHRVSPHQRRCFTAPPSEAIGAPTLAGLADAVGAAVDPVAGVPRPTALTGLSAAGAAYAAGAPGGVAPASATATNAAAHTGRRLAQAKTHATPKAIGTIALVSARLHTKARAIALDADPAVAVGAGVAGAPRGAGHRPCASDGIAPRRIAGDAALTSLVAPPTGAGW